jgi:hypothetical protein
LVTNHSFLEDTRGGNKCTTPLCLATLHLFASATCTVPRCPNVSAFKNYHRHPISLLIITSTHQQLLTSMAKIKKIFTNFLRLLALAATVVAIVFMVTSHDSAQVLNLTFTVKYSNTPVFK